MFYEGIRDTTTLKVMFSISLSIHFQNSVSKFDLRPQRNLIITYLKVDKFTQTKGEQAK